MPFPKRIIASPSDFFPFKAELAKEEDLLDSCTAAHCVGIMFQLGKLAEYATEMFAQIQNEVGAIHERVLKVTKRVGDMGPILSQSYDAIAKFRVTKRQEAAITQASFVPETRDNSIKSRYSNSRPRPKFELLQNVVQEDISKKYSNPLFFFEMWLEGERIRQEEAAQAAQKRKAAKGERKKKRQGDKGMKRVEAQKVQTKVYSAMGAEFQGAPNEFQPQGSMSNVNANVQRRNSSSEASSPASPTQTKRGSNLVTAASTSDLGVPKTGPMSPKSAPRASAMYDAPPVAPPMPSGGPPPPPIPSAPVPPPIPSAPSIPAAPMFMAAAPAPPPIPVSIPAPPPIPSAPPVPAPPPIPSAPSIPAAPSEGGYGYSEESQNSAPVQEYEEEREPTGLLAQLKGVQLRAAAPAPPKPVDAKSSLLAQIRDVKARNLKKVEVQKKEAPTPFGLGATVASILARRAAIEGSDDESGSEGEWEN